MPDGEGMARRAAFFMRALLSPRLARTRGPCNPGLAHSGGLPLIDTCSIVTLTLLCAASLFLIVNRQTPATGTRPLGFRHNWATVNNGNLRRRRPESTLM